ncbi:2-(1,2-epoxy-1,2-dihydrophenyl)acetyl-CoA isomerase PaaG [Sphingomonas endophytica]|uniref:2-(1,2-epoxy-1,2-dihydrophenyl)acetyl-CoA isomerase n=1 Tax=Sphingomonas endophytica TaxID=869719 RepID=A0ABR6N914_9SPHN|nr:enoyl-CoA hydratase-related protein [Sphingomonas endophytica]MBB5727262.1 2-(1,2-epoxy-1,2-dihydrophenyl)acetyl-CoA isomerase [Sphingomonas endophytica]
MTYETITFDLTDRVATLAIDRPARMNALTPRVFAELTAAIDAALEQGARAIVLTGTGGAFCSGADLVGDGSAPMPRDLGESLDTSYNPFVRKVAALDVPFLTAINGPAVGAGLGLALLGDISVMARSAYVLLAFVNIGLVPDAGATWLVAKAAGRTKALEMALLGERVSAEEALAAGLVTRVVDDEQVLGQTQQLAAKLAAGPSVAIGMIRKQVAAALSLDLDQSLAVERENQTRAGHTRDFAEAVRAFGEKRKPVFEGR